MNNKFKYILALTLIIIPFYFLIIFEKSISVINISASRLFGKYLMFSIAGICAIYAINRFFLKELAVNFFKIKEITLINISLGLLLLSITYFIISLGNITYFRWIPMSTDNTQSLAALTKIMSNNFYAIILLGPFIWISELFLVLSRAFILNNCWALSQKKIWIWVSIFGTALLLSLTQIDKGIPVIINTFLIVFASNILYFKYRSITPLLISAIVLQTIDLVSFWFYIN